MASQSINQRDLRMRSKEIMDAVERGESFAVTRDGREIGELVPLRRPQRFVSRSAFVAASRSMPVVDPDGLRADLDAALDDGLSDPFDRTAR